MNPNNESNANTGECDCQSTDAKSSVTCPGCGASIDVRPTNSTDTKVRCDNPGCEVHMFNKHYHDKAPTVYIVKTEPHAVEGDGSMPTFDVYESKAAAQEHNNQGHWRDHALFAAPLHREGV